MVTLRELEALRKFNIVKHELVNVIVAYLKVRQQLDRILGYRHQEIELAFATRLQMIIRPNYVVYLDDFCRFIKF